MLHAGLMSGACCFEYVITWVLCIGYLHVTYSCKVITHLIGMSVNNKICAFFDMLILSTWHMDAAGAGLIFSVCCFEYVLSTHIPKKPGKEGPINTGLQVVLGAPSVALLLSEVVLPCQIGNGSQHDGCHQDAEIQLKPVKALLQLLPDLCTCNTDSCCLARLNLTYSMPSLDYHTCHIQGIDERSLPIYRSGILKSGIGWFRCKSVLEAGKEAANWLAKMMRPVSPSTFLLLQGPHPQKWPFWAVPVPSTEGGEA